MRNGYKGLETIAEFYYLDYTHLEDKQLAAQGNTLCIWKPEKKSFFSIELERYPIEQDQARLTFCGYLLGI